MISLPEITLLDKSESGKELEVQVGLLPIAVFWIPFPPGYLITFIKILCLQTDFAQSSGLCMWFCMYVFLVQFLELFVKCVENCCSSLLVFI